MKIILAGGGTLGSVAPLIAIYEELKRVGEKHQHAAGLEFLWLGTKQGPERELVENYKITFKPILGVKLRRYFSWKNFIDIFIFPLALVQAFWMVAKFARRPVGGQPPPIPPLSKGGNNEQQLVILSAGGFVAVPVVWAGWLLGVPSVIHQQDVRPGLANILMAPAAKIITVTFAESAKKFPAKKTVVVGNPVRADVLTGDKNKAREIFQLESGLPTLLVLGGGTGALKINELIWEAAPRLLQFCQIIHFTGAGKFASKIENKNYHQYEFIAENLKHAYAASDLVISRAGMSTLSELAVLKKPIIIIPIPNSHQVDNAVEFGKNKAAVVLDQNDLNASQLVKTVKSLLADQGRLENLAGNIGKMMAKDAARVLAERVLNVIMGEAPF